MNKGAYCEYDTFINAEAARYLKLYFEFRRRGTKKIPPEEITDDSPLFRAKTREVRPLSHVEIKRIIRELYKKAGIISTRKAGRRYEVRPHSLRKFFRTQLSSRGVNPDYIEYMMGHKLSTYEDIRSLGIERLRAVYAAANISIRSETIHEKIERLKVIAKSLGINPDAIVVKETQELIPKRTVITPEEIEERQVEALMREIRRAILQEIKEGLKKNDL